MMVYASSHLLTLMSSSVHALMATQGTHVKLVSFRGVSNYSNMGPTKLFMAQQVI